jgi:hypothetical protein
MATRRKPRIRGYLTHLTHYDPLWCRRKARETPFDVGVGLEVVDALADEGFNLLVVDCADGVRYRSHPELAKKYTVPMRHLVRLAERAHARGLEVVPKLNFSRGAINRHNDWIGLPGDQLYHDFDSEEYWHKAFELIEELIGVCRPRRYFHIGMDEEELRSYEQYVGAIKTLRSGLRRHGLRAAMWNDSSLRSPGQQLYVQKALAAERKAPKDVVQVLWNYRRVPHAEIRRIRSRGFELWGAPGRANPRQVSGFRDAVVRSGGSGLLMTSWRPCRRSTRADLLKAIHGLGRVYRGDA